MTKANKPGSQKPGAGDPKAAGTKKSAEQQARQGQSAAAQTPASPGKQSGSAKNRKSTIGGTAIQGAKSTQPKEVKPATPSQQQAESYNREMRRRMQHMGMGPYGESQVDSLRDKRKKRLERKKKRQEEVKKTVVTKGPSTDVKLGHRNTYFLIGAAAFVMLVIVLAIIIRHPF